MNILELLERIEFPETRDDCGLTRLECQECKHSVYTGETPVHYPDCQLKAAIDALKSGRLVVVEKNEELYSSPLKAGDIILEGDECFSNGFGPWNKVNKDLIGEAYYPYNGDTGFHVPIRRKNIITKEQRE